MSSDPTIMKNDYPRVDKELYKKNPRAAFAKWEQLFTTYLAANETTGVSLDWTAVLDRAERQAYPSYPRPDNDRRRQRHRAGQIKTLLLCTLAWQDYLPTLLAQFKAAHYSDAARALEGDEPYPVGTECFRALQDYCKPQDATAANNARHEFEDHIRHKFPGIKEPTDKALDKLVKWAEQALNSWLDLSHTNANLRGAEQIQIDNLFQTLSAASMAQTPDKIPWRDFKSWLAATPEWRAHADLATMLQQLVLFAKTQYKAYLQAQGLEGSSGTKRLATVAFADDEADCPPCIYCSRRHPLDKCRGVKNLIEDAHRRQLEGRSSSPYKTGSYIP